LPAIGSVMISDTQQRHVERFEQWRLQLRSFLTGKRGRASRLAEHLGVRRQNVSRWFVSRSGYKRDVPAWAAVTANVWYHAQLVHLGSDKLICPPGERQSAESDEPGHGSPDTKADERRTDLSGFHLKTGVFRAGPPISSGYLSGFGVRPLSGDRGLNCRPNSGKFPK